MASQSFRPSTARCAIWDARHCDAAWCSETRTLQASSTDARIIGSRHVQAQLTWAQSRPGRGCSRASSTSQEKQEGQSIRE
jgi:hypothetical protein